MNVLEKDVMKWVELPTARKNITLFGRIIAHVHNDTGDRLRWADLSLYRARGEDETDPETFEKPYLLLYMVGHSLAVHAVDGCDRGVLLVPADFASKNADAPFLEPCPECNPGWPAKAGVTYRMEVTRYSHSKFLTATALFEDLRRCGECAHRPHRGWRCACQCKSYVPGGLSQLGRRLVEDAASRDGEVAGVLREFG